jgi:hypothetical protein
MSDSVITPTVLSSNQPELGGITLSVTSSNTLSIVSFNYTVFPGGNVSSSVNNQLYNRTVNVGTAFASKIDDTTYSVFIDTSTLLPSFDYYASLSALYVNGTVSPYTNALLLPLAPGEIVLDDDTGATITRNPLSYTTDVLLTVDFTELAQPQSGSIVYSLGVQYIDGAGTTKFTIVPDLTYEDKGVTTTLTDPNGIDEVYVAIQGVRVIDSIQANGPLSNTVLANDSDLPLPPRNLQGEYRYFQETPKVLLSWLPPFTADLTDVTIFTVYRKVGSAAAVKIGTVPYTTQKVYSFIDLTIGDVPLGSNVIYYVTSTNPNAESGPSNTYAIITVLGSSAPTNISATGVQNVDTNTQDVSVIFSNPTTVRGELVSGYNNAYFIVDIINSGGVTVATNTSTLYNSAEDQAYEVNFDDIPFVNDTDRTFGSYIARVQLITYQVDGSVLLGTQGGVPFSSGPAPIIFNINGEADEWNSETPLESFQVLSNRVLSAVNGVLLSVLSPLSGIVNTIQVHPSSVRIVTDPYEAFSGNYIYTITSVDIEDALNKIDPPNAPKRVLVIIAANASGPSARTITGDIN